MFRSGRRSFTIAGILMLLLAAAHTLGFFGPHAMTPAETTLFAAMDSLKEDMGSMKPSIKDVYYCLALAMTVLYVALGTIMLVLSASNEVSDAILRRISWINLLWVTAFTVVGYHYQIPPPFISGIILDVAVLCHLFLPGGKSHS
jgi:hypothetical protein